MGPELRPATHSHQRRAPFPSHQRASQRWRFCPHFASGHRRGYCRCSPHPLSLSPQAEKVGCLPGITPASALPLACSQGQAGVLAGASAPRYNQTMPTTSLLHHSLDMCEFGVDACGVASWLTPHVPRLSRVGRKRLGWGLSRDGPPPYPPCLRMQAGGGVVSLSREVEA